jgi:hypothetical protein
MSVPAQRVADLISAPMEAVIIALATGIAQAQRELDRQAIEMQREILEDPLLSEFGLQATFYQIPRADLELSIAIALEEGTPPRAATSPRAIAAPLQAARLAQLHLQPVNAAYTNQFSFDVNAASKLKLSIVPVPPPGAEGAFAPRLTRDQVLTTAQPRLVGGANPPADARLAVNFNGQGRLWFVLQYRLQGDGLTRLALVVIDDDTGQIVKAE